MLTEGLEARTKPVISGYVVSKRPVSLCSMAVIKDMISSQKIQLLKAPFLVHFISTDHSEVIYDAKQNINPFLQIQGYTLVLKLNGISQISSMSLNK